MRTRASVASKASPAILISGGQASGIHRFEEFAVVLRVAQLV